MTRDDRPSFEEIWEAWLGPVTGIVVVGTLVCAWYFSWVSPQVIAGFVAAAFVVGGLGLNTLHAARSAPQPRARLGLAAAGIAAAVLTAVLLWRTLSPGPPQASAVLQRSGDVLEVGHVEGGQLVLEAEPLPGVRREGATVRVDVALRGSSGRQRAHASFHLADERVSLTGRGGSGQREYLGASFPLERLGDGTRLALVGLAPEGVVSVRVDVRERVFPFVWAAAALGALAAFAAVVEAGFRRAYRRTYLTAGIATAAALAFALRDGVAPRDALAALVGRLIVAIIAGVIAGTVLPWALSRRHRPRPPSSVADSGA